MRQVTYFSGNMTLLIIYFISASILGLHSVKTQNSPLKFGYCLVPDVKTNFDPMMFFDGRWYKQLGFGSLFQDIIGICPTVEYKITDDGEIKSLDYLYNQILQVYVYKSGNSYTQYIHDNLGYLSFTFNLGQGLLRETFPMYIIDTDYDDIAIVYYCRSFLFFMKTEAAWVMSRSRNEATLDRPAIIDALKRSGLDYSLFKPEVNTGCGLIEPNL